MRRFITLVGATLAVGAPVAVAVEVIQPAIAGASPVVTLARAETCSSSYTHAVIGGAQKCLRAGEYCSHSEGSQYRRYHFVCERVCGTYRLEESGGGDGCGAGGGGVCP